MTETKNQHELVPILHQAKNELQIVLGGVDKLIELSGQLQRLPELDLAAKNRVQRMMTAFEKMDRLLGDVLTDLRELRSSSPGPTEPTGTSEATQGTERILVMDDELPVVELVGRVLRGQGYSVDTVSHGAAAIEKVTQQPYDLIIADLKMPDLGGMDVYQHIARHHPEQALRMVFISGDVMSPHTLSFLERTELPYLIKPFTIRELTHFVEKALRDVHNIPPTGAD